MLNANDRDDLERFVRKLAAEKSKRRPERPARTIEARVTTITPAEPLERT